jgi:flagellar motility protein MotE (MotC chaperone)
MEFSWKAILLGGRGLIHMSSVQQRPFLPTVLRIMDSMIIQQLQTVALQTAAKLLLSINVKLLLLHQPFLPTVLRIMVSMIIQQLQTVASFHSLQRMRQSSTNIAQYLHVQLKQRQLQHQSRQQHVRQVQQLEQQLEQQMTQQQEQQLKQQKEQQHV